MNSIIRLVKRHPLATFFGLAYAFSWGSYVILAGPWLFAFGPLIAVLIVVSVTLGVLGNYQRHGNTYISPDFDTAANRVDLMVSSGVGAITFQQISE